MFYLVLLLLCLLVYIGHFFLIRSTWLRIERSVHARCGYVVFLLLLTAGLVAGYWLAFDFVYNVGDDFQIGGFPLPVVFFKLEGGNWVDYIVPLGPIHAVLSVLILAPMPLLPLRLIYCCSKRI